MPTIAGISAKDLDEMLNSPAQVILLDVRQQDERDFAAIDGSRAVADLFVPIGELMARVGELDAVIRDNSYVVVYCHHGMRSKVAGDWLAERGVVNVLNLIGGIDAWSTEVNQAVPRY
jgi:rhodanese-related sulfurtransferase